MVARSRAERHEGEWLSVAAHLKRAPVRFTLTFAFGEMPEGWNQSRRGASTWAGIVTRVIKDRVAAQVEIQAGPHRLVSLLTREAVDELDLKPGMPAIAVVKATNVSVELPRG